MATLTYQFEELAIITEDGISAGLMNGTAEVTYFDDGEFHIDRIWLDGYRPLADAKGYSHAQVELAHDIRSNTLEAKLYLAIWGQLTDGDFKDHVQTKVSEALDRDGIARRDMNAEHRLTARELV